MSLLTSLEISAIEVYTKAVEDLKKADSFLAAEKMQSVIDRILKNAARRNVELPSYLKRQAI